MKHKYLFLLLTILMSMAASVASAHDFEVNGIYYDITSSSSPYTVAVTYRGDEYYSYSDEYTGSVSIPESVTYDNKTYSVTCIYGSAFRACSGLTSVTIPNSVTTIEALAFYKCTGLKNLVFEDGDSQMSLGKSLFYDCPLETLYLGRDISYETNNSQSPLGGISTLTSVTIGNNVTNIGDYAFFCCYGLTSVTIPNSVTSIGMSAFSGCSGLGSIVVNSGNTVYDSREGCNAIIETASNTLIRGCKNTTIPNSVTSIGWGAFFGCIGLTSITIPNSVTSIGNGAFSDCI